MMRAAAAAVALALVVAAPADATAYVGRAIGFVRSYFHALPYDHTSPVVYDNDSPEDVYTDELLLALHTQGRIVLRGMITTNGGYRDGGDESPAVAEHMIAGRAELLGKARRSGMAGDGLPVLASGPALPLVRPPSGRPEDTKALDTPGARLLVEEARRATPERPLVLVAGGPVTAVADAFLGAPDIADRVVVAWAGLESEWNADDAVFRWASQIVLRHFRVVLFPLRFAPTVRKAELSRLPATELRRYMLDKQLPHVKLPGGRDGDAAPVIPLITGQYVRRIQRGRWVGEGEDGRPIIAEDRAGNIWRVVSADRQVGTEAWWETMTHLDSWGGRERAATATPFSGRPAAIPGRVEAEAFDDGGPDVAYAVGSRKSWSGLVGQNVPLFRVLEHVPFAHGPGGAGIAVAGLGAGEWTSYSLEAAEDGAYRFSLHCSPASEGTVELMLMPSGPAVTVDVDRAGGRRWRFVDAAPVTVPRGALRLRMTVVRGRFDIDHLVVRPAAP